MFKKALIGLGLITATTLSGCIVATPRAPYSYAYVEPGPVVVAPIFPVFGFYGGYYHHGWGGYRGGYGYRGGGHWR